MAFGDDQFNILIKTTADTSGIQQTSKAIDDLKKKAAEPTPGIDIAKQIAGALGSFGVGLTGGLTILAPALGAIYEGFNKLNAELDAYTDKLLDLHEKQRQMALDFIEAKEWADKLQGIKDLPLIDRISALTSELARLKEEQQSVISTGLTTSKQLADAKMLESQINQITNALRSANNEERKLKEQQFAAEQAFLPNAIKSASRETQTVLENERKAREAQAEGNQQAADQFQNSADQIRASMTPSQLEELRQIKGFVSEPVGRRAGAGESQDILDQIALNQLNFERQQRGEAPATMGQAKEAAAGHEELAKALDGIMSKYWGP